MTGDVLTEHELDALFDGATESICRLETLPAYSVDSEADRFAAWRDGLPRPEQSVRTSPWLAEIAASTLAGVRWSRVGVVDDPPTDYQRFRMAAYGEMQAAGCSVSILPRRSLPAGYGDFWLFDAGTDRAAAAMLNYTESGRFVVAELSDASWLHVAYTQVLGSATPLNSYLASGAVTCVR